MYNSRCILVNFESIVFGITINRTTSEVILYRFIYHDGFICQEGTKKLRKDG